MNMMDWTDKMRFGMMTMMEACKENKRWDLCRDRCPFDEYCTALMEAKLISMYEGLDFGEVLNEPQH